MADHAASTETKPATLLQRVLELSGEHVEHCYNCGKCTAGCPVAAEMDLTPQQIMRMVQLGQTDRALQSKTIWVCASCETCSARCPMKVGVAEAMDALRQMAIEAGVRAPDSVRTMQVFHREFLNAIRRWGRLNEVELIGMHKLMTGAFTDDLGLGLRLFAKQKIRPWHLARVKNGRQIEKLFEAALGKSDH